MSQISLGTAKANALFFYLATTGQPHSRATLVNLLWGEMAESKARRNLTTTLTNLRKVLAPFLVVESDRIAFQREAPWQLDVHQFQQQLAQGRSSQDMRLVREAVARYRGDFLDGLTVKDGLAFEEWLYTQREQLREQHLQALQLLVDDAVVRGDYAGGIDYAHQLLALDPWRETAHRQLMILHMQNDRRYAALAQYESCRQVLAEELGVDPSPETMALHQRLLEAESTPTHNLPPSPSTFVGREQELQQIHHHLIDPACRLLTLVGPGGVGKTRLALEAGRCYTDPESGHAAAVLEQRGFGDGIYFVALAGVANSAQATVPQTNTVITAIAAAIGYSFSGSSLPQEQLVGYLSSRALLLIVDNFEEYLHGEASQPVLALLTILLEQAPHITLLLTSRARLKLQAEWVLTIDGLPFPKEDRSSNGGVTTAALREYAAANLFLQRAEQVQMGFAPSAQDTRDIIRLCQLLEGLPLGLELAAQWVTDLTCGEIVAEIEQGIDILSTDLHNLPARHRSLRAVIEYSWQLLTPEEQQAVGKLAVFRGGFTRPAATEVANASLPMLVRLVDHALIRRAGDDATARRHDMHALIQQFARQKLQANEAEWSATILAHSTYYVEFAEECYARYLAGEYPTVMPLLMAENDNLSTAWTRLVEQLPQDQSCLPAIELLSRFVRPLAWFYQRRARYREGIDALKMAASQCVGICASLYFF